MNRIVKWTFPLMIALLIPGVVGAQTMLTPKQLVDKHGQQAVPYLSPDESDNVVVFVDSGATQASDSLDGQHGQSWDMPFATVDYAIDRMTTGGGTIRVSAGTTESVVSAGDWALDAAGIRIIGEGEGDNRPVITFTTAAAASVAVSADDCLIENMTFVCNIDSMTHGFDLTSDDLTIRNCLFKEGGADGDVNGLTWITADGTDADVDNLLIEDCTFLCPAITNWTSAIELAKDFTNVQIRDSFIWGDFSDAGLEIPAGGNAQVGLYLDNVTIVNTETGDHAIELNGTGNTGVARNCTFGADTAGAIVDAGGIFLSGCEIVDYDDDTDTSALQAAVDAILVDTAAMDTSDELEALVDPNAVLLDSPRVLVATAADLSTGWGTANSPKDVYTVTGDIKCRVVAIVDTACISTGGAGTLELGVAGDTACLLVQDIVDGASFQQNDAWSLTQGADTPSAEEGDEWVVLSNGLDIEAVIATSNMTAGAITFYLEWIPLSADAAVVSAL